MASERGFNSQRSRMTSSSSGRGARGDPRGRGRGHAPSRADSFGSGEGLSLSADSRSSTDFEREVRGSRGYSRGRKRGRGARGFGAFGGGVLPRQPFQNSAFGNVGPQTTQPPQSPQGVRFATDERLSAAAPEFVPFSPPYPPTVLSFVTPSGLVPVVVKSHVKETAPTIGTAFASTPLGMAEMADSGWRQFPMAQQPSNYSSQPAGGGPIFVGGDSMRPMFPLSDSAPSAATPSVRDFARPPYSMPGPRTRTAPEESERVAWPSNDPGLRSPSGESERVSWSGKDHRTRPAADESERVAWPGKNPRPRPGSGDSERLSGPTKDSRPAPNSKRVTRSVKIGLKHEVGEETEERRVARTDKSLVVTKILSPRDKNVGASRLSGRPRFVAEHSEDFAPKFPAEEAATNIVSRDAASKHATRDVARKRENRDLTERKTRSNEWTGRNEYHYRRPVDPNEFTKGPIRAEPEPPSERFSDIIHFNRFPERSYRTSRASALDKDFPALNRTMEDLKLEAEAREAEPVTWRRARKVVQMTEMNPARPASYAELLKGKGVAAEMIPELKEGLENDVGGDEEPKVTKKRRNRPRRRGRKKREEEANGQEEEAAGGSTAKGEEVDRRKSEETEARLEGGGNTDAPPKTEGASAADSVIAPLTKWGISGPTFAEILKQPAVLKLQLPTAGTKKKRKRTKKKGNSEDKPQAPSGKKSKAPMTLDLFSLLKPKKGEMMAEGPAKKKVVGAKKIKPDQTSAGGIRMRGKEREKPKKKPLSKLKRLILEERRMKRLAKSVVKEENSPPSEIPNRPSLEANDEWLTTEAETGDEDNSGDHDEVQGAAGETFEGASGNSDGSGGVKIVSIVPKAKEGVVAALHSRKFRDYCTHFLDPEINSIVRNLMTTLMRFQDKIYEKERHMFKKKRRFVNGLREVLKFVELKKIKIIIMAPDIEPIQSEGGLDDIARRILDSAQSQNLLIVFTMSRYPLGRLMKKPVPVSCVGILNFSGCEDVVKVLRERVSLRSAEYARRAEEIIESETRVAAADESEATAIVVDPAPQDL